MPRCAVATGCAKTDRNNWRMRTDPRMDKGSEWKDRKTRLQILTKYAPEFEDQAALILYDWSIRFAGSCARTLTARRGWMQRSNAVPCQPPNGDRVDSQQDGSTRMSPSRYARRRVRPWPILGAAFNRLSVGAKNTWRNGAPLRPTVKGTVRRACERVLRQQAARNRMKSKRPARTDMRRE